MTAHTAALWLYGAGGFSAVGAAAAIIYLARESRVDPAPVEPLEATPPVSRAPKLPQPILRD